MAAEVTPGLPAVDLPKELGSSGWTARDNARVLAAEQFAIIQDGEIFLEYGLERVIVRSYHRGRETMIAEVLEMKFPTGAYGLVSFNRRSLPAHRRELQFGRYVIV